MPIRVLIVDDSSFYRSRIEAVLRTEPQTEVVGSAANGIEAVKLVKQLSPDVITMDYEMPGMDGISAIEEILSFRSVPILMLSAMTVEGAQTTLKALEAGATDFMPKTASSFRIINDSCLLIDKIKEISHFRGAPLRPQYRSPPSKVNAPKIQAPPARSPQALAQSKRKFDAGVKAPEVNQGVAKTSRPSNTMLNKGLKLVVVGASTGGPVAVQQVLSALPENFPVPILLIIHMPSTFTEAYAHRLNQRLKLHVVLAQPKMPISAGEVYVAPGGAQTLIDDKRGTINVVSGKPEDVYHPCLDYTLASASKHLGPGVLGIVLTGMGADGQRGAMALKSAGGNIWVQDPESCVVYGMPQAVVNCGAADAQVDLDRMGERLNEEIQRAR